MQGVLFDSAIYIDALRRGETLRASIRGIAEQAPVWFSAVVLEELHAGARGRSLDILDGIEHKFDRGSRILTPTLDDWIQAGRLLARLAARYDYESIGRGRLTNDALIATSAGRKDVLVVTTNDRDFGRLAEFHPFRWHHVRI